MKFGAFNKQTFGVQHLEHLHFKRKLHFDSVTSVVIKAWSLILTIFWVNYGPMIYFLAKNGFFDQFLAIENRRNRGRYLPLALESSPILRTRRYEIH